MIDKLPAQFEAPCQLRSQSFHPKSFGCVMSSIKNVDPEFFGEGVTPMRSLAGDECIDPFRVRLRDFAPRRAGDNTDPVSAMRSTRAEMRSRAEYACEPPSQFIPGHSRIGAQAERLSFPAEEWLASGESQCAAQTRGVADFRMDVERKVRAVDG